MVPLGGLSWRLRGTSPADGDAICAALSLDAAQLSCGPFWFDFTKVHLPGGELGLTLAPASEADALDHAAFGSPRQLVPSAPSRLPADRRRILEAEYLQRLGRALFDDVARLVQLEMEFR